ncbi:MULTISPECIES: hypothetical protein [Catenuloplanes]|uniref:Uncharacterized protein n=1 Tax=Catenuloplanes niger TaxID=587534 RepID=A0AAE4CSV4_9ACTN|nr:hypothetical protein [Catenuloplanes niger]MDR7324596.1 hypothetical protein [Catenuloplanes niger]
MSRTRTPGGDATTTRTPDDGAAPGGPAPGRPRTADASSVTAAQQSTQELAWAGRPGRNGGPGRTGAGADGDDMGRRSDWRDRDPADDPQEPQRPPDSYLDGGDPVYHRPGGTAVGYDSSTMWNYDHVAPVPGYHDVVVHGEPNGLFHPGLVGADGDDYPSNWTHPGQIADAIRNNPHYDGGPVRLVSCHTGRVDADAGVPAAGQQVADALGVPVMAPTDAVGTQRPGPAGQTPTIRDNGEWVTFQPRAGAGE